MSKPFPRVTDLRSVKVDRVIRVERVIGEGVKDDPHRTIVEIYELDGKLIARHDQWKEDEADPPPDTER